MQPKNDGKLYPLITRLGESVVAVYLDFFKPFPLKILSKPRFLFGKWKVDVAGNIFTSEEKELRNAIIEICNKAATQGDLEFGEYHLTHIGGGLLLGSSKEFGSYLFTKGKAFQLAEEFYMSRFSLLKKALETVINPEWRALFKQVKFSIHSFPFIAKTTEAF